MQHPPRLESAKAMQSAFRVQPEVSDERTDEAPLGIYSWRTPPMEGFSLPSTDDLIVALHLGGSRRVRAVTNAGLSRTVSMPGLVTLLPPHRPASFRTAGSISLVTLHLPQHALPQPVQHAQRLGGEATHFAFRDPYVSASMEALLRAARLESSASADYVLKITDALICHLSHQDTLMGPDLPQDSGGPRLGGLPIDALLAMIDARIASKLCIDDMARETGLSRAGFSRAFRQGTGYSFHQYLTHRRISRAKQMLRQTGFDLAYISQELGFANQSHFAAAFKALQNCTPREFRNQRAADIN